MIEHPDLSAIQRRGYPAFIHDENHDNAENRRMFAEENIKDFIEWVLASSPDAIEEFVDDHKHLYNNWLN